MHIRCPRRTSWRPSLAHTFRTHRVTGLTVTSRPASERSSPTLAYAADERRLEVPKVRERFVAVYRALRGVVHGALHGS